MGQPKIEHIWSVLCSQPITNQSTNNVSLIEVVEEMTLFAPPPVEPSSKMPAVSVNLHLVSLWCRAEENAPVTGQARVQLRMPTGTILENSAEFNVLLTEHLRWRSICQFQFLPIEGPGRHVFLVELKEEGASEWLTVARVPLYIRSAEVANSPQ